ncbi:MAG: sulfatase-like hydrolase/transferase, partial [Clostridia bacterium]
TQNFNFEKNIRIILNEKDKYESSKDNYIINLLKENSNHILFSLDEIHNDDFLNKKTIDNVIYKKNIKTIKLLNKKQTKLNIINKSIKYSKLLHLNYKSSYNYLYNSYFLINSCKKIYGYNNINDFTKYMPSFDYQMNYMIDNVLNDDDSKQFMYLHVEDMHHPNTFFSYESKNEDDLQEEIDRCNAILTSTPNNYKGLLSYDLSLGYTDLVLERLFRKLKNKKCFEETTLIITADHGSSFHMSPLRESLVNNFHIENYNIPLFIFNNNIVNEQLNGLYSNIDVLPTVLDIIDCPNNLYEMDGKSILNFEGRDYAFVEYEGPGCPNMVENKIWYALRSKKYLIGCKVGYKESVNVNSILEIYDLERDFTEEHNLVKDLITEDEILKMIRIIADRHENIKSKIKARYE